MSDSRCIKLGTTESLSHGYAKLLKDEVSLGKQHAQALLNMLQEVCTNLSIKTKETFCALNNSKNLRPFVGSSLFYQKAIFTSKLNSLDQKRFRLFKMDDGQTRSRYDNIPLA